MAAERVKGRELDPGVSIAAAALFEVSEPPVVASNRGPFQTRINAEGGVEAERGPGGVVTALVGIPGDNAVFVASPMTELDRTVQGEIELTIGRSRYRGHFVNGVDKEASRLHYGAFSNPLLWFIQHGMSEVLKESSKDPEQIQRAWEAYLTVNRQFAETILGALEGDKQVRMVILQDYQLDLVPRFLRERVPEGTIITHFTHIPWPEKEYWEPLPKEIRIQLLEGLTAADIVGFQTETYRENFLATCTEFLPGARVQDSTVRVGEHKCRAKVYPISIDVSQLRQKASSREVARWRAEIEKDAGELTIVRVDRVDPTKNIVRGFEAFELLLEHNPEYRDERHPEYRGHPRFLAFLVPSRTKIPEYQEYAEQVNDVVDRINERYGTGNWQPVKLFLGDNQARAIAGMQLYDVLLVNPVADGMNLVSKEGPIVNDKDGVLVLSETAGSADGLRSGAILVSPEDVEGTASALHEALQMPKEARTRRIARLRAVIERNNLTRWWNAQFKDILDVADENWRKANSRGTP